LFFVFLFIRHSTFDILRSVVSQPLDWIEQELAALEAGGLRRRLRVRGGALTAEIELDGRALVNFGANDYLGLAGDPRLVEAVVAAAREEGGWGSGASPLVIGRGAWHQRLEARLAQFEHTEAALVFSSGFAANSSTIAALASRGDVIFGDELNHASLIDGCRLSRADVQVYSHRDVGQLETLLRAAGGFRRRLIVTDTLFSMDGDLAPLAALCELAGRYEAMLLVDEAHATGVFGACGRGLVEELKLDFPGLVRIGTLSKALGSSGGFVCGSRSLIEWLANRARAYVFSTAGPGPSCAAALAALEIVDHEPERRERLLNRAAWLRDALRAQGWNTGNSASQIVPVIVGEASRAVALAESLAERGPFVPAIRPPSVPPGLSRLRISLSSAHSDEMLARLVAALAELR
jgi:8-amino-7-oxononanoate synthase